MNLNIKIYIEKIAQYFLLGKFYQLLSKNGKVKIHWYLQLVDTNYCCHVVQRVSGANLRVATGCNLIES